MKKLLFVLLGLASLAWLVGSFEDYPLNLALYDPFGGFGKFIEAFGPVPGLAVFSVCTWILGFLYCEKWKKILCFGLSLIMDFVSGYVAGVYGGYPWIGIALIGLVLAFLIALGVHSFVDLDNPNLKRICWIGIIYFISSQALINGIKIIFARPRMRLIMSYSEFSFQPWWHIQTGAQALGATMGIASEEFKSFPSAHVANAALGLWFLYGPFISKKKKGSLIVSSLAIIWLGMTMVGRMCAGAHFLSDVSSSLALEVLLLLGLNTLVYKKGISSKKDS